MTATVAPGIDQLAALDLASFRRAVLDWFDARGRVFRPRDHRSLPGSRFGGASPTDPDLARRTGLVRFTTEFPTVRALAAASPADVLRAWQGLGYNRRAINLRRAARVVVDELGGEFPRDVAGLERLPGAGPYTARAVASIAFRIPAGAVDTI